jgi:fructose-1,6-bisphosphatase/inositol monophosphatase family enzyme
MVEIDEVARIIRETAAAEILPRWRNLESADIVAKTGPNDIVTVADRAAEESLSARLKDLIAGSKVVGEEGVHADASVLGYFTSGAPVWVIDPIDGTSAFAKGDPDFAVMVALVRGEELLAGWILAPVSGEIHMAERGAGVWRDREGNKLRLQPPDIPSERSGLVGLLGRRAMTDARRALISSRAGEFAALRDVSCAGIDYPRLLTGEAHFAVYNKSEPWDHLPGLMMAVEQGFVFSKHDGSRYRPGDNTGGLVVAPNDEVSRAIRELLLD